MWFLLAVLSAFFNSLGNVARRTHGSLAQPAELAWWSLLFSLPLTVGFVLISHERLYSSFDFVIPAAVASVLSCFGGVLLFRAYKYADASVICPLTNLLPIAMVPTTFIFTGQLPAPLGFVGVLLVVAGVYYSSVSGKHSLSHPLGQIMKSKGSRAMIGWVVITSVVVSLVSLSMRSASPSFLLLTMQIVSFVLMSGYLLARPQRKRLQRGEHVLKKWGRHIAAISLFSTVAVLFQYHAMSLANPTYVMSVKRLDVLMTVLMASVFLHEKHILRRIKGSLVAIIGIVIIVFLG